jgi:hypothetical protein
MYPTISMIKKTVLLLLLCTFFGNKLLAQGLVNVNPLTGAAGVTIPIYTLSSGQVSLPVSVSYYGTGAFMIR